MDREAIYRRLPVFAQNLALSAEGWRIMRDRYGAGFDTALAEAEQRLTLDARQYAAFRDDRLSRFIRHAATTVPYYRSLFKSLGAEPGDFQTLADLQQLPELSKRQVQEAGDDLRSETVGEESVRMAHTSGTTGAGLRFAVTRAAQQAQWAVWWRYFRLHGIEPDTWCGYFGGRTVVPVEQSDAPFWRVNRPGRQVMFSAYHTSRENLDRYLEALRHYRPPWLHGYPSHLALVAGHLSETGFDLGYQPKWITSGAENLMPHQVRVIADGFGVTPVQHYGMAEAVANFSMCDEGRVHVDEDFAGVEFLPIEGTDSCRIVGTNATNPAMPLLRYDVMDQAKLSRETCSCGHPGRVVSAVDGRREDVVVLANGARVGRLDHIFKDQVRVREAQVRQSEPGAIRLSLVAGEGYGAADEAALLEEFASRLGRETRVTVEYCQQLERTGTGKLRFVISDLE